MKKIFILTFLWVFMMNVLSAQESVTIRFTGENEEGNYVRFSSVEIKNITRDWTETITYPDTTIVLGDCIGIDEMIGPKMEMKIINSMNQGVMMQLTMPEQGYVRLEVFDLTGKMVTSIANNLERGVTTYELNLQNAAVYIVRATSSFGCISEKAINMRKSDDNEISQIGIVYADNMYKSPNQTRVTTSNTFQPGDMMQYTGYVVTSGETYTSEVIQQAQYNDEDITLVFDIDIPTYTNKGFYLTIMGFNNGIPYVYSLSYLDEDNASSVQNIYNWIDNMETDNGTALFYTMDQAMNNLQNVILPSNLFNVSLVSFTDGIDNASVAFNPEYSSRDEYQRAMRDRIRTESFHDMELNAYGIGVKSDDVGNLVEVFNQTIRDISSDTVNNAFILEEFEEINVVFSQIASNISTFVTTISATFEISYGGIDQICLTFDGNDYATSQCKITADLDSNRNLTNVAYTGLTTSSGTTVNGAQVAGALYSYTFEDLERTNGEDFSTVNARLYRSSLAWGEDSEFDPELSSTTIENRKTAAIALVLDMSSSLGNNVTAVKNAAKAFINNLINPTEYTPPTVTTGNVSDIGAAVAKCRGTIENDGNATVTERGFCWSTSQNPTLNDNHTDDVTGMVNFLATLTGLTENTTYYVRAYATNSQGTAYGNQKTFTTMDGVAVVTTNAISNVTGTSAVCGGNVTTDGGFNVTARGVCWSTSQNPTVADSHTTNGSGTGSFTSNITGLSAGTTYYVRAYATNSEGTSYGEQKSFTTNVINGHEYVDLGLPSGLKWTTCNIGASSPEEYGNYYAWGETETKTSYDESNSVTYGQQMEDISGNAQYDAARANWGGTWRMPTKAEYEELLYECTWLWTTQGGVNGYKVTGPNGNHIFLPAAGSRYGTSLLSTGTLGFYWSSTPYESSTRRAYYLYFNSSNHGTRWSYRYYGNSVRPVSE